MMHWGQLPEALETANADVLPPALDIGQAEKMAHRTNLKACFLGSPAMLLRSYKTEIED